MDHLPFHDRASDPDRSSTVGRRDASVGGFGALGVILLLTLSARGQDLLPSEARLAVVLAWPLAAIAFFLTRRASVVIVYAISIGFLLRWAEFFPGGGSDVLLATREWLNVFLHGGNPYDHFYLDTKPPGSVVPYPPLQHYLHLPGYLIAGLTGIRFTQVALAVAVIGIFAALARKVSWTVGLPTMAAYAAMPNLINLSVDAGNDTGTGAVLLVAVLGVAWAASRSFDAAGMNAAGLGLAAALATKQSTLLVVMFLVLFLVRSVGPRRLVRPMLAGAGLLLAISLPFLLMDPGAYLHGLTNTGFKEHAYGWNVWILASSLGLDIPDARAALLGNAVATIAAVVVLAPLRYRSVAEATMAGTIATLVAFLTAYWTGYTYFGLIAPIVLVQPLLYVGIARPVDRWLPVTTAETPDPGAGGVLGDVGDVVGAEPDGLPTGQTGSPQDEMTEAAP